MNSANKVAQALAHYRESFESAQKAACILGGGPASYYFVKIEGYVAALFDRFAPFKEGDRVALTAAPNTNNHWHSSRHFLIPGALGTVECVDFYDGAFCADVVFDDESWIYEGVVRPAENKHTYRIWDAMLAKITDPSPPAAGGKLS